MHVEIRILLFLAFLGLGFGVRLLLIDFHGGGFSLSIGQREDLERVRNSLWELEELLASGIVPPSERWQELRFLPDPWGAFAHESLLALRSGGASILPTLKRFHALADRQIQSWAEARSRSSQSRAQAIACSAMIPLLGLALYWILPGVAEHLMIWLLACGIAASLAAVGAFWLLSLSDRAQWAGLAPSRRPWILASQIAGETFLASLRGGSPPDLAWIHAVGFLSREAPDLAHAWGGSVWKSPGISDSSPAPTFPEAVARALVDAGEECRKAIQVSLMEGRACADRVEGIFESLRRELKAETERELHLLGTRSLQPLFICIAPTILGLLGFGILLAWSGTMGDF